jgi:hypothetical protein
MASRLGGSRRAERATSGRSGILTSMVDAAAKHVAVLVVTALVAIGGVAIAKFHHLLFPRNMPTLNDFSGRWWLTIGSVSGEMTIKQTKDRQLTGTYVLENGISGDVRGRHDGYSFYNLVFVNDHNMRTFVESAPARLVGDCLVVDAVSADLINNPQRSANVRFSARGCEL